MTNKEKLEKLKKLADAMYYAAMYLTTDASHLRKTMEDYHQFIVQEWHKEELVSGNIDFEQELYKAFGQVKDFTLCMQIAKRFYDMGKNSKDSQEPVSDDLEDAAEDYCKSTLVGSHSIKKNAFKAGAQWQKGQMMAKAIDAKLLEGHLIRQKGVTHPLHIGDKVKVIIIKEDKDE